ncbi:OmpA family protein [Pontibacter amylolyticus]|uniref:Cell envelope biogenesis protein OmpA n=1 Tax=Pontibacter amylolyticus TaxID=1424080 RepID=A0ABQ1W4N5_9BACT|nr:OmpA family protein [Pontibacter amylolyticus]GGG12385.1 cell envelope biogenesis protein OmpA [Pontibacter amylolyticus]
MNFRHIPLYLTAALLLGAAPVAQAQQELRKANKHYEKFEFALALEQYKKAAEKRKPDVKTAERIADSYRLTRQAVEAERWYAQVVAMPGRDPQNIYHYAEALRSNGKYEEAKQQYMLWAEEVADVEERAQYLMASCDKAMNWINQKMPLAEVQRLSGLNAQGFSDFSPMNYGKDAIIFTSDRGVDQAGKPTGTYGWTGRPYLQLFMASRDGEGNWGKPTALHEMINDQYHNATASATEDGQTLYFTRTQLVQQRKSGNSDPTSWVDKSQVQEYINRLEIYSSQRRGTTWTEIKPFAFNNVTEYSVGHPALSPDGKIMYFVSDMPGGVGETDIYYTLRQPDGSWGEPVNAGILINTPGRESFPYVDQNGKLYFSSDGHMGMGGLDVFAAEGKHAAWTAVNNMGHPINSSKNDYGIMFNEDEETGLLSSNRESSNGTDDIYSFKVLQKPVVIAVTTLERKQNEQKKNVQLPLPQVQLLIAQQNQNDSSTVLTNTKGQYFMDGRKGNSYVMQGSKQGFLNQHALVVVPKTAPDTLQVAMVFDRDEKNVAIVLENIYYDLDKWDIRSDAAKELDKLAEVLVANPTIKIELSSHTDSRESMKYNQVLSERRAQAAVDYLIGKGIAKDRLTAKGYGKTRLVNKCTDGVSCPEEMHQQNRRTEFRIK